MTTDTRNPNELCEYTLKAFGFLAHSEFVATHSTSPVSFSIDYKSANLRLTIGIGLFTPRYEYCVTLSNGESQFGLDELPSGDAAPRWTWAHSDPAIVRTRIDFSAALLRSHLDHLIDDYNGCLSLVNSSRSKNAEANRLQEIASNAENAFRSNDWATAVKLYSAIPDLTAVQAKRLAISLRNG